MEQMFEHNELLDLQQRRFHPEILGRGPEHAQGAVLFGAGGGGLFFLRFMRMAGAEPAFFVDNNETLWGATVSGVEVRPPSALLEYPNVTVVLCTAFYLAKLTKQCRELGVTTAVPYYNFSRPPFPFVVATDEEAHEILSGEIPRRAYALLADDISRIVYKGTLAFRVTQDVVDMPPFHRGEYFLTELFQVSHYAHFVDGGAFDGDTLREFLQVTGGRFDRYDAFEPDPDNFSLLEKIVSTLPPEMCEKIYFHCSALGAKDGIASFQSWGNACSALDEEGDVQVRVEALDDCMCTSKPTFIKLDIEGAELEALLGMEQTIRRCRPILAICVYHAVDHLWRIPLWIDGLGLGYRLYLRKHSESYSETVCYALPE
ncbi:MAG: FkbM family methyltransferase [Desulfuromonadales bacterium]